jgi:hypothetical protein
MIIRRFIAVAAVALIGLFGALILAQGHGQRQEPDLRRGAQHTRFDAKDRANVGEWYRARQQEQDLPNGFQSSDVLSSASESRLRVGELLDPDLRSETLPVPSELLQKLPPAPGDYRYLVLDGHLLLVDQKSWNVSDVLHFELDFGRA